MSRTATRSKNIQALDRIMAQIEELDLQRSLLELITQGYTVVEGVLDADRIDRAKGAVLNRIERITGKKIDLATASDEDFEGFQYVPYLLYEDQVFEEILMEPKPLALVTYLVGESCLFSNLGSHFKGPGGQALELHADTGAMPGPYPAFSQFATINYALTPYSREGGALAIVPCSHYFGRQPTAAERNLDDDPNPRAVSVDLAPGDAVVWHSNTWHGSFKRTIPGIRAQLGVYFARPHLQTQERHKGEVPEEFMKRNADNDRMMTLLGEKQPYGWQEEGPDYRLMAGMPTGLFD